MTFECDVLEAPVARKCPDAAAPVAVRRVRVTVAFVAECQPLVWDGLYPSTVDATLHGLDVAAMVGAELACVRAVAL